MGRIIRDLCVLTLVLFVVPAGVIGVVSYLSLGEGASQEDVEEAAYQQVIAKRGLPELAGCDFTDETGLVDPQLRSAICTIADAALIRRNDAGLMVDPGTAITMQADAASVEDALVALYERLEKQLGQQRYSYVLSVYYGRRSTLLTVRRTVWSGIQVDWMGGARPARGG